MNNFHSLSDLSPDVTGFHIKVKVLRSFEIQARGWKPNGLGLVVADNEGLRIEAFIDGEFAGHYKNKLETVDWITLTQFRVALNTGEERATYHRYKIVVLPSTIILPSTAIPHIDRCYLINLENVINKEVNHNVLVDVAGHVFDVEGLSHEDKKKKDTDGYRVAFKLKNSNGTVIQCAAKGQEALDFWHNMQKWGDVELVPILRWWKVDRTWDGPNMVRLTTCGPISAVYPYADNGEVRAIRQMLAQTKTTTDA